LFAPLTKKLECDIIAWYIKENHETLNAINEDQWEEKFMNGFEPEAL
jgi:hypothetical protein